MPARLHVDVPQVPKLIERISAFNRDIYTDLQREVREAGAVIADSAKGMIPDRPLRNWGAWGGRLDWDASAVSGAIKSRFRTRRSSGTRYVVGIVDTNSAPGNVYALAGSQSQGPFSAQLNGDFGTSFPRALGPAWTMHVDEARGKVQEAVDTAARRVTSGG